MIFMSICGLPMLRTGILNPKIWGWMKYDNSRIRLKSLVFCRGSRFLVFDHAPFSSIRGEKCEMKLHGPHKNLFRLFLRHNVQGTQAEFLFSTETQWAGAGHGVGGREGEREVSLERKWGRDRKCVQKTAAVLLSLFWTGNILGETQTRTPRANE